MSSADAFLECCCRARKYYNHVTFRAIPLLTRMRLSESRWESRSQYAEREHPRSRIRMWNIPLHMHSSNAVAGRESITIVLHFAQFDCKVTWFMSINQRNYWFFSVNAYGETDILTEEQIQKTKTGKTSAEASLLALCRGYQKGILRIIRINSYGNEHSARFALPLTEGRKYFRSRKLK